MIGRVAQAFVESRVAILGIARVDTSAVAIKVGVLVHRPGLTTCHNDGTAKVVIVQAGGIAISVLFVASVEVVFVEVEGIIFVAIGSTYESDGTGQVVEAGIALQIEANAFAPSTINRTLKKVKIMTSLTMCLVLLT